MQQLQEEVYGREVDYRYGSPHLSHPQLHDRLLRALSASLAQLRARHLPPDVLEVGAGHGGFTQALLAWGYHVTATEMSRPSLEVLRTWFGQNPGFAAVLDADGSLARLGDSRFSAIVAVSVLHHIPDYIGVLRAAVSRHLARGGSLITFQDPLWHARQPSLVRIVDLTAYFSWRMFQGRLGQGLRTRYRRLRHVYDDTNPADAVEYHVVRQGVDHHAIVASLGPHFEDCRVMTYWSAQSGIWQTVGDRLRLQNTFGLIATGYLGTCEPAASLAKVGYPERRG